MKYVVTLGRFERVTTEVEIEFDGPPEQAASAARSRIIGTETWTHLPDHHLDQHPFIADVRLA